MPSKNQRTEAWFRALFEQSPLSTQVFSPDGRTIQVNRAWERLWGASIEQVADYNVLEDQQLVAKGLMPYIRRGFAGEALAIPAIWYDPNETLLDSSARPDPRRWVQSFIHPVKDDSGALTEVILIHEDMTDQKLAELAAVEQAEQLRIGEERFRLGLKSGVVTVFEQDADLRYTWLYPVDPAFPTDHLGKSDLELLPNAEGEALERFKRQVLTSEQGARGEFTVSLAREVRHYDLLVEPRRDSRGEVIGICGTALDITLRKRIEDALRSTEASASLALGVAKLGTWKWDLRSDLLQADARCREICGLENVRLTLDDVVSRVHPEDRPRVQAELKSAVAPHADGTYHEEYRFVRPDGAIRWVVSRGQTFFDESADERRAISMLGTVFDITERKHTEDALRRSEQRFSRFMQHLPGLAWAKDVQGRYVFANDAALKAFKTTREQLYKHTDDEVFPPQTAAQFKQNDERALLRIGGMQVVETLVHEDGVEHQSLVSKFPITGAAGDTALIGGIAIDITELNQAQVALRTSEQRLRLALTAGRMGVWEWNLETNEVWWSDNLEEIHGLPAGSFPGSSEAFEKLIHPEDRQRVQIAIAQAIETGTAYDVEFRNIRPDGAVHWMAGKGKVFADENGKGKRMIGVALDVTERVKSQQERDRLILQLQEGQIIVHP